ncbi:hypothetical protein AB7309_19095 [Providencia manganoxydans]|uniref:hypothetical protein n=1 Tax=Providencia manganoxydans TaxID=2923283 RepID=UPI0034E3C077
MKNPKLITKPFAQNGQKNAIPENFSSSMESNQATWDTGFGQITMLPVAAGGLPPKGQDFNGIFNQISENIIYLSKGGKFKFSADYAASINGYPKGAILQSDDEKKEYQSIIDNNKVNFNTATQAQINAAWKLFSTDDILEQIAGKQPAGNYALKGDSYTKGESDNRFQPKGNYAPSGDYATKTELTTGLGKKIDTASITQTSGTSTTQVPSQSAVTTWMEDRYSKAASDARYFPKTGGVLNGSLNATSLSVKTLADTVNFYAPNSAALMGYFQYNEGSNWGGRVQIPRLPLNAIETILHSGNVKQSLGDSTSDVLSQNAVKNLLIGFGQKYSNVTQSRSKSTKYVNTTGKPITILISAFYLGSGSGITAVLQVDGVDFNFRSGGTGTDNAYKGLSITAIIPEGSSYMLTSALGTIESWVELR